jgi:pyruvate-formate lyase
VFICVHLWFHFAFGVFLRTVTMIAGAELTYRDRIARLREKKLQQTREKLDRFGPMDEDDYGTVPPPPDFRWSIVPNHPDGSFYGADGWARNFASLMAVHPVTVDPLDALAGRWMFFLSRLRPVKWPIRFDYSHLVPEQEKYGIVSGIGSDTHFGPDYRIGLELGWGGLLEKVRRYRRLNAKDPETEAFYQAEEDVILAVQAWIRRTLVAIRAAEAAEPRPELRRNLREMAEANTWIVEHPPRTLREACQWIAWFNMASRTFNRDGAGDQLDEILRPYYERDLAAGRVDDEAVIYLIACLLLNDPHYYQLGGPGPDGKDLTSRVSFLILEAAHRLGSSCNLTIRVHDGLDRDLFMKSVRHLFADRLGWPRYSGNKGLVEGFMRNGYPVELARRRIATGCHWMALPGREYTMNDCVKINAAKVFEVAFQEMMADPGAAPSVADLWRRFEGHLRRAVLCTATGIDFHLDHQRFNQPELLLNLLCHGPIEKGRDVTDGGIEYYNMCCDGSALATVADSFAAIEQRIEREKVLGWRELADQLKSDFAGTEGERVRRMLRSSERYGQGRSLGDAWAVRVSRRFSELVVEKPTPGGRRMIPGWFSWSNTISMGKIVGATPNGRRAGEPISHGANPDPGFRADAAPTAMAKAIAEIQPGYGNTAPFQLELDPGLTEQEGGIEAVAALIVTHFDLGGTLFNINIIDAGKILAAHQDPTTYPDLVVRVTGFTAYFANLSPEFRQLVVDRIIAAGGLENRRRH